MGKYVAYPEYVVTGDSEINKVPVGWNYCSLKRYLTVQSGDMLPANKVKDEGIPVVGGNGFRGFTDEFNTSRDTVVIGRVGAKCGCIHTIRQDFWASEHAFKVIPRKKYSLEFMAYCLASLDLNKFAITTAQPLLNTEIVTSKNIAIPRDYDEQQIIANFLDHETAKIDTLIEKQQQLIALLKEKRQAVISHAVTKGLNPDAPMKNSGVEWLGEVPEHWDVTAVSKISEKITNGYVGPTRDILVPDGVPYVQATHIKRGVVNFDNAYFVREPWSRAHAKSILVKGDVLIVQTGAGTGDIGLVTEKEEGFNCHALIIVQPKKEVITGDFLSMAFQSQYGYSVLFSIRTGGMHPHLNCGEVQFVKLPIPPLNEQIKITDYVNKQHLKFDKLIEKQLVAIELMQERRTALISAAVTGKIDVRNWSAA